MPDTMIPDELPAEPATELTPAQVLALFPPHGDTLPSLLASRAAVMPDAEAVLFQSRSWTYHLMSEAVETLAAALVERGIRAGDPVAHVAPNSDVAVLLFLALARVGAVFVPLNPALTDDELHYQLQHSQAVAAYAPQSLCARVEQIAARCARPARVAPLEPFGLDAADSAAALACIAGESPTSPAPLPMPSPDHPAVVIYTSGTTGFPKGVVHSQRTVVWSAEVFVGRLRLQPRERMLTVFPLFHVNALFYSFAGALACGGTFITAAKFSASTFWQTAADTGATQLNILAALGTILGLRPRSEFNPAHRIRKIYGGPISADMFRLFQQEFGVLLLIEGYGMSEIPSTCSNPYEGPHKIGSIGRAGVHPRFDGPFAQLRVVDDDGHDVAVGETGELLVKTPTMFVAYLNDPQQTADTFRDGWFATGDLVRMDTDGYFYFVAREKDIIRKRGENISGAELDAVLGRHPELAEAATIAVPSELGEDDILAVLVARDGTAPTHEAVIDWCRAHMAAIKVPRYLVFADALPKTPTQRVAKHLLKKDAALIARARDMEAAPAAMR
ncbi:MAG: class I adenylate-forming enzyme family protein [Pseudomonadota bacterium]